MKKLKLKVNKKIKKLRNQKNKIKNKKKLLLIQKLTVFKKSMMIKLNQKVN